MATSRKDLVAVLVALAGFVLVLGLGFGLRRTPETFREPQSLEFGETSSLAPTTTKDTIIISTLLDATSSRDLSTAKNAVTFDQATTEVPANPHPEEDAPVIVNKILVGAGQTSLDRANEILSKYPVVDGYDFFELILLVQSIRAHEKLNHQRCIDILFLIHKRTLHSFKLWAQ